jgi:hypothetical protein
MFYSGVEVPAAHSKVTVVCTLIFRHYFVVPYKPGVGPLVGHTAHCETHYPKGAHTRTSLAIVSGWARVPLSQTRPCVECHEPDFGRLYIRGGLASQTRTFYGHLYTNLVVVQNE